MIQSPLPSSMQPSPTDENIDFNVKLHNTSFDWHDSTSNSTLCPTNTNLGFLCNPSRPALAPRHPHNFHSMSSLHSCSCYLCQQQQEPDGQHEHESSSNNNAPVPLPSHSHEAKDVNADDAAQTKPLNLSSSLLADTFGSPPSKSTTSNSNSTSTGTANREASSLANALPHAPYPHGYPAPHHHYGYGGNPMRTHADYAQAQAHAHHMHMQYYAHDMYHRHHQGMGSPPPYHPYYPPPPQENANENSNTASHNNDLWGSDSRPVAAAAAAAAAAVSENKRSGAGVGGEEQKNVNSHAHAHVDSQSHSEAEPNCKYTQLIPSPPPKKRKYVMNSSWDEHDDHAHLCAASPGIFRSPDAKARAKGFGFVSSNFETLCFCILLKLVIFILNLVTNSLLSFKSIHKYYNRTISALPSSVERLADLISTIRTSELILRGGRTSMILSLPLMNWITMMIYHFTEAENCMPQALR